MPVLRAGDFQACLDAFMPRVRNYDWAWKILRARAAVHTDGPHLIPRRIFSVLKRFMDPKRPYFIGTTAAGVRFLGDYRDRYAVNCAVWPDYDGPMIRFMGDAISRTGGDYADVGTNLGIVSASMAKALRGKANVLAFEPVPDTAGRAAATYALNGLTNITLFQLALGDTDGEIPFFESVGASEGSSANRTDFGDDIRWRETRLMCRRLDGLVADGQIAGAIGLLKVDVEGHELKAIQGATDLIRRDGPDVIFEYYPKIAHDAGWAPADIAAVLKQYGNYQFETIHDDLSSTPFPPPAGGQEIVNVFCRASAPDRV